MENETHGDAAAELAALKDLEMRGFVEASKDPLWVWPVLGLVAGLFIASFEVESTIVSILASIGYAVGVGSFVGMIVSRRGVQPRMRNMPGSLKRIFGYYVLGVAVAVAIIFGLGFGVNFILGGIAAFVIVTAGGIWYHVRWRCAVDTLVAT